MGGVNKEKIVLLLALVVLAFAIYAGIQAIARAASWEPSFQEPAPSPRGANLPTVDIRWFEFPKRGREPRDPFEAVSEWRPAEADALPLPPLSDLRRRVPLPAPLFDSRLARLPRESVMPVLVEEEEQN
ncbi:MAG: hypothetical protein AB7O52_09390 [Planctomycetota bacterium]